jgi:hypothetical protein
MKMTFARLVLKCLLMAVAVLALAGSLVAQPTESEKNRVTSLIDSEAKTAFSLAWPTAGYGEIAFEGIQPAKGGFDVTAKLSGKSAFGGDLWVRLVFQFRDGKLSEIHVKDNSDALVRPFLMTNGIADLTAILAQKYAAPPEPRKKAPEIRADARPKQKDAAADAVPAAAPSTDPDTIEGACLKNETGHAIGFEYRLSNGGWRSARLEPAQTSQLWWPSSEVAAPGIQLEVRLGQQDPWHHQESARSYTLERLSMMSPASCAKLPKYYFDIEGTEAVIFKDN